MSVSQVAAPPHALAGLIEAEAHTLALDLAHQLRRANAPHYRELPEYILEARCERLVAAFVASCGGNPGPFAKHVRRITRQRMSEGYYLEEIQQALTLLEQRAWQLAAAGSSAATLVRSLSIVTGTIGQAKDELARAFFAGQQHAEAALTQLRTELLFSGTERPAAPRWLDAEPEGLETEPDEED